MYLSGLRRTLVAAPRPPALRERLLGTMFRRFVVTAPDESLGQVHSFDEPSRVIVRILVAHAVPECAGTAVVSVSQLRGYRPKRTLPDVSLRCPPSERSTVRFRG
jgi:hypothetical protein